MNVKILQLHDNTIKNLTTHIIFFTEYTKKCVCLSIGLNVARRKGWSRTATATTTTRK